MKNKLENANYQTQEQNRMITRLERTASSGSATAERLADEHTPAGQELPETMRALIDETDTREKQASRAEHYFRRSQAAETSNSRLKKSKATIEEETDALRRTQVQTKTELSKAVAEVQQVLKHCGPQIEELEANLRPRRN